MSNLIKAAEELEYVPKENLIQMAQAGDTRFPPYLVLAEIQRRTQNEKAYSAMQPPPTTTVAEEKVAEFAQSGLGGMASPLFSPPPEDLPMSPPMQMAASGGLTGYANEGKTKLNYSNVMAKLSEDEIKKVNQIVMQDRTKRLQSQLGDKTGKFLGGGANISEQIFSVLGGGGGNIPIYKGSPEEKKFAEVANIILENKNKKASGGLTGYANQGRTTYQDTFSYRPTTAGNVPISQQGLIRLLEERGITSEEEQEKITSILSNDLARFSQPRNIQIADVLRKSEDFISEPYKGIDSPFANIADRRGFAGDILEGVSPGPEIPKDYTPPVVASNQNNGDPNNNNPFNIQGGNGEPPPTNTQTTTPTTDVFGTLDELRKRMKDVEYKSPTADDLRNDRTSETLMYLGSLIAGSTDRKQFGEGLSDLTSKVVASKRADDRFLNEAKLKERGLFSSDLQLATALETLKVKAVQAKNTAAKNKIDEALGMIQAANLADQDTRKRLLEKATQIFLGLSGESTASQADLDTIVSGTKS